MNRDGRLVIVGGGPAGLATARAYRDGGGLGRVVILTTEPYPPYNRPPLTKEFLRGESDRGDLPIVPESWYRENDVELRPSTVVESVDREGAVVETDAGGRFPTTPASSRRAPSPSASLCRAPTTPKYWSCGRWRTPPA